MCMLETSAYCQNLGIKGRAVSVPRAIVSLVHVIMRKRSVRFPRAILHQHTVMMTRILMTLNQQVGVENYVSHRVALSPPTTTYLGLESTLENGSYYDGGDRKIGIAPHP